MLTHHRHDGLDGVGRGLFAAGLLDEAGAEVLDVEGHSLYHGFAHGGPVFGQLWKKGSGKSITIQNSIAVSTHAT